ncbi:chitin synthase-domain-containing protein [Phlyctochytrium arcticum]|nr:chitin synthase-domain-containing protein [Phlyctochytrium arcticum]KAI9092108.1 chitin synthase-domain-containing protein [Phlyctochytrium arcticum]
MYHSAVDDDLVGGNGDGANSDVRRSMFARTGTQHQPSRSNTNFHHHQSHQQQQNNTLNRRGTLSRPERHVNHPLLRSQTMKSTRRMLANPNAQGSDQFPQSRFSPWTCFARTVTGCCPGMCLSWANIKGRGPQQAWREKVALCFISFLCCAFVMFFIVGLNPLLCPTTFLDPVPVNAFGGVAINGVMYNIKNATNSAKTRFGNLQGGADLSDLFARPAVASCARLNADQYAFANVASQCELSANCLDIKTENLVPFDRLDGGERVDPTVAFSWDDIDQSEFIVVKDIVLNLKPYFDYTALQPNLPGKNNTVDRLLHQIALRNDGTRALYSRAEFGMNGDAMDCLINRYRAGRIAEQATSCILANLFSIIVAFIVLSVLMSRFVMAVLFDWLLSRRLAQTPQYLGDSPIAAGSETNPKAFVDSEKKRNPNVMIKPHEIGLDLYTVMLVTCYSEGQASLRTTIESLAATDYTDSRKVLFIVADGLITGKGEPKSTPDLLLDMIEIDETFGDNPKPYSYIAVASGSKQHNMARVYVGHFVHAGHRVPTVLVIKCGTPEEASEAKPGNRGKRDSQLILMNFFTRVLLNDRMTPLDFDLFRKLHHLMHVTPDYFEIVLMVDADTKVRPNSLRLMINAMINDQSIMGLCGETRIANKTQSWVTMIQVFEYYISHHLGKAFESVFGGVTCLPGCFCMYRIKARKENDWVPVLANPDVVETYSTNDVDTLHQKNLLLLGEDRFLTTMMLKTFPNRKMVFIPQAVCKTVVPDDFATLLSQRRRWINSTIHNLMELTLVNNLCGTFCFSMQFIVLLDLISTAVLPASIVSTLYLLINELIRNLGKPMQSGQLINIGTLLFVIFFPVMIVLLSFKRPIYILWMMVYILALPIWNFVLPLYAFWHFDDFSWGATRQVTGETKGGGGHGDDKGMFDGSKVSLKRWEEYERAWRRNIAKGKVLHTTPSQSTIGSQESSSSHGHLLPHHQQSHQYNAAPLYDSRANASTVSTLIGGPKPYFHPQFGNAEAYPLQRMGSETSLGSGGSYYGHVPGRPGQQPGQPGHY